VWWFWILIAGFIVCALTLAVGTVVNIFSRRLKQVEEKATITVDGVLAGLPKQSPEPKPSRWKPAWQKLQWANAERERLEGEVRKLKEEIEKNSGQGEFDKLANEDSAEMGKRLITCGIRAKLELETVEPYIDVTFRLVNTSIFPLMSEKVEGNAFYRGYSGEKCPLSRSPIIVDPMNFFSLPRGELRELTLRQFVPLAITDNIAANNDRLKLDLTEVRVHFMFAGTGGHNRFWWFGDVVEVGSGLEVSNEDLAKLGIIPKPSGLTRAKPEATLRGRVLALAEEMLTFLRERDCEAAEWETEPPTDSPPTLLPLPALKSLSVADHALLTGAKIGPEVSAEQKTMDGIHYGYERQFKNRLSDLLLELKEHGIGDFELERNANGFPRYYCFNIRKVAERLLIVWSRMQA